MGVLLWRGLRPSVGGGQGGLSAVPSPRSPHPRSESPVPSDSMDAPMPPPELEPVGCDEETQPLVDPKETPPDPQEAPPDPKEAPPGNAECPPGELASVEVPPSEEPPEELPSDELPLDQPPPDTQPSDIQPPDVQPPEEPLPLLLPPEEPPCEELPLETPSLAELPPDRPSLEELPPSEPPHNELPLDVPLLAELPPEKPAFEKSPPHELPPPEVLPVDKSPPDELPPNESPPKPPPLEEPPLSEPSLDELPLNKPPPEELPPEELPPSEPPPIELLPKDPLPEALPPEKLSPEEPPLVELAPEEPVPSELPPEEDLKPPGNLGTPHCPLFPPLDVFCGFSQPWLCLIPLFLLFSYVGALFGVLWDLSMPGWVAQGGWRGPPHSLTSSLSPRVQGILELLRVSPIPFSIISPMERLEAFMWGGLGLMGSHSCAFAESGGFTTKTRADTELPPGEGFCWPCIFLMPSHCTERVSSVLSLPLCPQLADVESSPSKEEDEDDDDTMQNTVVLFSNTDKFVLMQDMCVVCGSFGRGAEGHLLACSQCSQCYHPYCVNSKITKVMLLKGWRCVECIVCEVCGKASDPSRLLLCDDCDISYHTYCLDPPLQTVPKGGWKCKWCVCCVQCGAASPGFHCEWQNNYTHCAPCASLVVCPFCREKYVEDDLLIQCRHCDR
uniref:PHD-type domain-containing protein n=1 Tax=Zonotrichia albicollis TaxID=44394 RepID=A0A8D2M7C5_ZONAL